MVSEDSQLRGDYSPKLEASRILDYLVKQSQALNLPQEVSENKDAVCFNSTTDEIYFPIPFKETETLAALKGVEALVAGALADLRYGQRPQRRQIQISLEAATYFGCQAYMAKVGGLGKLDPGVRARLKGMYRLMVERTSTCLHGTRYGPAGSTVEYLSTDVRKSLPHKG
jgi:hypothetical protein